MVPVGGAIIVAPQNSVIPNAVAKLYPGRASISPILDLFITLLSMGAKTWRHLLSERETSFQHLKSEMERFAGVCYNQRGNTWQEIQGKVFTRPEFIV